jgi:predicted ester cyclase
MSVESTCEVITRYVQSEHSDLSVMADDVVFTHMATGDEHHGPEGVRAMLDYVYHVAFEAHAETRNMIFADGKAVLEADFVGKHIGEFAGIAATGRQVRVPLCVVYDLENNLIKRGRVYMEMPVLLGQLQDETKPS